MAIPIEVRYTCSYPEWMQQENLKGIVTDVGLRDETLIVDARFSRGTSHPDMYEAVGDYPVPTFQPPTILFPDVETILACSTELEDGQTELLLRESVGGRDRSPECAETRRIGFALGVTGLRVCNLATGTGYGSVYYTDEDFSNLELDVNFRII